MGFFDRLKAKISTGSLKKEQIDRLRESIWNAIADGDITEQEISYINDFFAASSLTQEEFSSICTEIFLQVVQQFVSDKRVDQIEQDLLSQITSKLPISRDAIEHVQRQLAYYSLFAQIESGSPLPTGTPQGLILQKSELCHASLPAQLIEERVVSRDYKGGTHGVSIRLVKGVRYRVGGQKGKLTSQSGLVPISDGYFVITNKRVVFTGDRKSVATPIRKLLDLHVFSDGLNFSVDGRVNPVIVHLSSVEEAELCGLLISRLVNENS